MGFELDDVRTLTDASCHWSVGLAGLTLTAHVVGELIEQRRCYSKRFGCGRKMLDRCASSLNDFLPRQHRAASLASNRETYRPIPFAAKGCRRTMFSRRSASPAHVAKTLPSAFITGYPSKCLGCSPPGHRCYAIGAALTPCATRNPKRYLQLADLRRVRPSVAITRPRHRAHAGALLRHRPALMSATPRLCFSLSASFLTASGRAHSAMGSTTRNAVRLCGRSCRRQALTTDMPRNTRVVLKRTDHGGGVCDAVEVRGADISGVERRFAQGASGALGVMRDRGSFVIPDNR